MNCACSEAMSKRADAAKQGYSGLLSFGYYLDHLDPAGVHYANDPMGGEARQVTKLDDGVDGLAAGMILMPVTGIRYAQIVRNPVCTSI